MGSKYLRTISGMDHLSEAARIRRGVVRLNRRLRQERGNEAGLTPNQLIVLGHLHRHGSATPGEVAVAERQRPQSLTRVFGELEAEGLISREPSAVDRRQSVLTLTVEGRRALDQDMGERDVWLAEALGSLSATERGGVGVGGGVDGTACR